MTAEQVIDELSRIRDRNSGRVCEIEFRGASFGFASLPESGAGPDYWRPYLAKPHSEAGIRSLWFGIETTSRGQIKFGKINSPGWWFTFQRLW